MVCLRPADRLGERRTGVFCASHKVHQRTKSPGCWSSKEVKPRNRRLQAPTQPWKSVHSVHSGQELRREERIVRYVDSVSCACNDIVHFAEFAVVQMEIERRALESCGKHLPTRGNRNAVKAGL